MIMSNKIAIVGASQLTSEQAANAKYLVHSIMSTWGKGTILVSGGATGIDSIAESVAKELGLQCEIFLPKTASWSTGYRPRNLQIARTADHIISIAKKGEHCLHCAKYGYPSNHQKSGGCWTAHQRRKSTVLVLP